MIKSISISGFKKFDEIKFEDFRQINLFIGVNNVGKTTLLEAILSACCGQNINPAFGLSMLHRMNIFNGVLDVAQPNSAYKMASILLQFFHNHQNISNLHFALNVKMENDSENFSIKHKFMPSRIFSEFFPKEMGAFGNADTGYLQENLVGNPIFNSAVARPQFLGKWQIDINNNSKEFNVFYPNVVYNAEIIQPLILARYNDAFSHREENENRRIYAFLSRSDEMDLFTDELNKSFLGLNIKKIENIPYPDGSEASISLKMSEGNRIPLYAMGDGVRRWYNILGGMIIYSNGVHCLEEVDSAFHYEAQKELSKNLIEYAEKYNNQLFMTTHNKEYMNSLLEAARDKGPDFMQDKIRIITLRAGNKGIDYRVLDAKEAMFALDNGLELRI